MIPPTDAPSQALHRRTLLRMASATALGALGTPAGAGPKGRSISRVRLRARQATC
jgi:hypothetical protein